MKIIDVVIVTILLIGFITAVLINKKQRLFFRFDRAIIEKYLRSQDISHEVVGRVFLSDGDIHMSAGYLYIKGANPVDYNFQHPPLIKYLYGLSILIFNNPHIVQFMFGYGLLILTYVSGRKMFNSPLLGLMAAILLVFDRLFIEIATGLYLDTGQSFFCLAALLSYFINPNMIILQAILVGLMAGSKFWAPVLFYFGFILIYDKFRKKIYLKRYVKIIIIAFIVFSLIYIRSFIVRNGWFNIIFFQLKILKYWFNHSQSTVPFSFLISFVTGFVFWNKNNITFDRLWIWFWPIGLISSVIGAIKLKKIQLKMFLAFPGLYLLYLGIQAPYQRYFIMILPFIYIGLAWSVIYLFKTYVAKK